MVASLTNAALKSESASGMKDTMVEQQHSPNACQVASIT